MSKVMINLTSEDNFEEKFGVVTRNRWLVIGRVFLWTTGFVIFK